MTSADLVSHPKCLASPKILIVLNSLVAEGCPQLALQLANQWLQHGISVELFCLEPEPNDLRTEFETLGVPIYTNYLGKGLARYLRLVWISYQLCRAHKPSSVLSFPLGWHSFIALGARLAGVHRVCAHVGNLPPVWTGFAFAKFKLLVQIGRAFTYKLLCCSEYIRLATVRDFGVMNCETLTVYNACDLDKFASSICSLRAPAPDAFHVPKFGMVARLEQHKDQPTLIRAMALLRDQSVEGCLWLIGEGTQRTYLESLVAELDLAEHVQFLGSRRDVSELLGKLDVFVFSARPDEGFGIALAEAMAAGVPIVATDVGACREVLQEGSCGLLVEPVSAEAFAQGICDVLDNPQSAHWRAEKARQRALRYFSAEIMADTYANQLGLY